MLSKEFLIKDIPVLKPTDTGSFALSLMEDYKLKHLPIVNDSLFLCLLSEKDIFLMSNMDDIIKNVCIYAPYAGEGTSILDVLRIMVKDKLTLLPVVNSSGIYVGAITLSILTEKMAEISNACNNGATIAIELNQQDYDLANIVHLTESNNSKILSLFSYPVESTGKLIILLKIDLEDISSILRSLERFNYKILYYSQKEGIIDDIQRKRLDELMYYLNM